jgi:hypothetical protein
VTAHLWADPQSDGAPLRSSAFCSAPVSLSEAVQYMTKGFLKQNDPVLKAERNFAPGKESKPPVEGKRIVRAQTKHEVNLRDQGQCTHRYPDGKRCQSRRWVDMHHVIELAHGGSNTAGNLTTLCAGHHRLLHRPVNSRPQPDLAPDPQRQGFPRAIESSRSGRLTDSGPPRLTLGSTGRTLWLRQDSADLARL